MFEGISIEEISKFPPALVTLITTLIGLVIGALLYGVNQFVRVITTDEFDKLFVDKATQVKVHFWYYLTGILWFIIICFGTSMMFFGYGYNNLFYEKPNLHTQLLILDSILFFPVLLVLISWFWKKELKNSKFNVFLLVFNMSTSIIFFTLLSGEKLSQDRYLDFVLDGIIGSGLLGVVYFRIMNRWHPRPKYDIKLLTEDEFRVKKNLSYEYTLDEKKFVFFTKGEAEEKVRYVCDFSSKIYMQCTKQTKKGVKTDQTILPDNTDTKIVNNLKHARDI